MSLMPYLAMWATFDASKICFGGCFLLSNSCPGFVGRLFDVGIEGELAETRSEERLRVGLGSDTTAWEGWLIHHHGCGKHDGQFV